MELADGGRSGVSIMQDRFLWSRLCGGRVFGWTASALRRAGVRLDCFGAAEGRAGTWPTGFGGAAVGCSAGPLRRCGGQVGNLPHWLRLCGGRVFGWTASALRRAGREPAPL